MDNINLAQKKTSKLAMVSLVSSVFGFFWIGMILMVAFNWPKDTVLQEMLHAFFVKITDLVWLICLVLSIIITFFFGELSWLHVKKRNNEIQNKRLIRFSFILGSINVVLLILVWILAALGGGWSWERPPRWDPHFKATVQSTRPAALLCCDEKGEITTNIGKEFCIPNHYNANWPNEKEISSIKIIKNCQEDGSFEFVLTPPNKFKGACTSATCTQNGCTFECHH